MLEADHRLGLVACNATLGFALPEEDAIPFVQELWDAQPVTGEDRYYNGVLQMMNLLHVSGKFERLY